MRPPASSRQGGVRRARGRQVQLRRGFTIPEDAKVLMVEDIVNGRSVLARMPRLDRRPHQERRRRAACLIDRSNGKADLGVKLVALCKLDIPAYPADALPPELAALPPVKPGSRAIQGVKGEPMTRIVPPLRSA